MTIWRVTVAMGATLGFYLLFRVTVEELISRLEIDPFSAWKFIATFFFNWFVYRQVGKVFK